MLYLDGVHTSQESTVHSTKVQVGGIVNFLLSYYHNNNVYYVFY